MIFIYGEVDPWSATRVPIFKGKVNEQVYIQPGGSHRARIGNMPEDMKEKILTQINKCWQNSGFVSQLIVERIMINRFV